MSEKNWVSITGFEGYYETNGKIVRSIDRKVYNKFSGLMFLNGRELKHCKIKKGEKFYKLSKNGLTKVLSIKEMLAQ